MSPSALAPRCSLVGRWFDGGRSGVCLLSGHPRCRIPALVPGAPSIPTEKGWLRPERALAYDNPTLLLHHAAGTHPGARLTNGQLAGFSKTATRLLALLRPYPWANPVPLEWPQPEILHFHSANNALLYDLITLRKQLQQAEVLSLHTLETTTCRTVRRC